MFSTKFTVLLALFAATAVQAGPIDTIGQILDVWNPDIVSPQFGDHWIIGQNATVAWDASQVPQSNENSTGLILLGYEAPGDDSEHLDIQHPLATNFPIFAGNVTFTVPNVTTRSDYIIVLFGDSGNASPPFTISP